MDKNKTFGKIIQRVKRMHPFIIIFVVLLVIDTIWLTLRYKSHEELIVSIQKEPLEVRVFPAFLIYVLISTAIYYFVFIIADIEVVAKKPSNAFRVGSFLGIAMYGVYDLTNYATLNSYTLAMTFIDMLWGGFLCGFTAFITSKILYSNIINDRATDDEVGIMT